MLCQAQALPEGEAPELIHLLPAGEELATVDGRGPYRVADLSALATASLAAAGGRLPIDETHATDLAAPQGRPAPARGWIVELLARADGLWGKVEWNETGRQLLADKAYRFISPVIRVLADNTVTALLRASLTNTPNLRGIAALNAEEKSMDLLAKLREALGLAADADEAAIVAAIKALKDKATGAVAAQSAIARAAGLKEDAAADAIQTAIVQLVVGAKTGDGKTIVALQAELTEVTTRLNKLTVKVATDNATAFVDGEIRRGRVGVKQLRDHYIAMHALDPARVENEIGSFAILGPSGARLDPPAPAKDKDGKTIVALNAEQANVAKVLGIKPEDYAKTLAAEAAASEAAA